MKIGFVILSHNEPGQLLRLVKTLSRLYDNPPIVIHHDVHQCLINVVDFPKNATFMRNAERTRWAQFSVVTAALRALKVLYRQSDPDWFFLLSGADYPTANADTVSRYLSETHADALLDYRTVGEQSEQPENPALAHFISPANSDLAYRRYVGWNPWIPVIRPGPRIGRKTFYTAIKDRNAPFSQNFRCYYGDHWFTGNSRTAAVLLNPTDDHLRLRKHLKFRTSVDECYYQTVLANERTLKISRDTKRYARWMGGGSHPRSLEPTDLDLITRSGAFFARKFAPNAPILDCIDEKLKLPGGEVRTGICDARSRSGA